MADKRKKTSVGRPKKAASDVRVDDLRIPLTPEEKQQIRLAATAGGGRGEMAEWSRQILLTAAVKQLKRAD